MKCQHEGCEHSGDECTIKNDQVVDVVDGHYCGEHAALHGFCPVCGDYCGGITSFEERGVCDHCWDEIQADQDYGEADDFIDDDGDEIVGSCDNCGSNIYADEADSTGLCGQCQWFAAQNMPEQRASE